MYYLGDNFITWTGRLFPRPVRTINELQRFTRMTGTGELVSVSFTILVNKGLPDQVDGYIINIGELFTQYLLFDFSFIFSFSFFNII